MKRIKNPDRLFDVSSYEFPEFVFKNLSRNGILPYWAKCAGIFVSLYVLGIATTFVSNTLLPGKGIAIPYIMDYSFLMVCIVSACSLAYALSTLRKFDKTLLQLNKRLDVMSNPNNRKAFEEFVRWMRKWMPFGDKFLGKPVFWYYLETIGGAILGAAFAIYWSTNPVILSWGKMQYAASSAYFIFFCAMIGYIIGGTVFVTINSVRAIRCYCRTFISAEKILALNPDKVGGLRPIGQFSLGLDITFALPSFVIFSYLAQGIPIVNPVVATVLTVYTLILIVVFFIPLSAVHDSMLEAKETAYDQVNEIFKQAYSKLSTKEKNFNLKQIKTLKDIHFLYGKVTKMAVWPLNLNIVLKFIVTSSFPIVGSLIVTYISKLVSG